MGCIQSLTVLPRRNSSSSLTAKTISMHSYKPPLLAPRLQYTSHSCIKCLTQLVQHHDGMLIALQPLLTLMALS